ncbi:histidine phosphatase family protein [Intestinibacter bartlettii]|uniref:histidine phosphatase family protein n=1 Tax=Intestinibacter bartlettii TaxID=261299 RepID=UPI0029035787|nr:histidine phosphatase family protein [Intestinibacter bartlettii]MDU2162568.1 histidine phosphatase family protein [Intestinibacter bartlettii]
MTNTIYIVRHGQTEWNLLGKTQGHGNSDLTPKGIEQAELLADNMTKYPIDYIYSSDLGRAYQTAEIIGNKLNIEVEKTEALREMNFGTWEGRIIKDIIEEDPELYKMWRNEPHLAKIPQGETLSQIKERTDAFIKEINEKYDGKHIVLVTHSLCARIMLLSFLDSDVKNIYRINQANTALNIIELRDYGPVVMKMNDTTHIINDTKLENSALE